MNDNISRQKLIEELTSKKFAPSNFINKQAMLLAIIDAIKSQPPADQWIPCSEPPKEDGMYLITAKVLDKLEVQHVFYQKNLDLFICNGKPIAWMPAEPYKGVE